MKKLLLLLSLLLTGLHAFSQDALTVSLELLYKEKQYAKIIAEHAAKAQTYPARAVYYVSMAYYMGTDDTNCLKSMELSLQKDSTDADAWFIKGMTLNYLGEFSSALDSFTKAIARQPEHSQFYSGLGDAYFNLQKTDKALEAYRQAIAQKDATDRPYLMIPQLYAAKNEPEKALEAYYIAKEKVTKETDSYATVLYNIGLYELLNKNYEKAETALQELIYFKPDDFSAYAKLIQVYYGKREYEKAAPYRQKLYEAHALGLLEGRLQEMFCFDQFHWKEHLIQAFERYEEKEGALYYKHLFYVLNAENRVEYRIQTEYSPISIDLGGPKYIIGMDKNGTHATFGFGFNDDFIYDDLKNAIINVIEGRVTPAADSSPGR